MLLHTPWPYAPFPTPPGAGAAGAARGGGPPRAARPAAHVRVGHCLGQAEGVRLGRMDVRQGRHAGGLHLCQLSPMSSCPQQPRCPSAIRHIGPSRTVQEKCSLLSVNHVIRGVPLACAEECRTVYGGGPQDQLMCSRYARVCRPTHQLTQQRTTTQYGYIRCAQRVSCK